MRTVVNQRDLDNYPWCVGTCLPDYGSQRVDCGAEAGIEFFPGGSEGASGAFDVMNADTGTITQFYAYNDGTNDFMVAGPIDFDPVPVATNYEPAAEVVNDRCGPDGQLITENVHHIRGGLFREWGGGMGRRLLNFTQPGACSYPAAEGDPDYCADADPAIEAVADNPPPLAGTTLRTDFYSMMVDLRAWEGISFWARGGPNNTGGVRVGLGDRQLDDDVAFIDLRAGIEPSCGRVRECGCRNHRPCTPNDFATQLAPPLITALQPPGTSSCWQPGVDPSPGQIESEVGTVGVSALEDRPYDACGVTACNEGNAAFAAGDTLNAAPDPLFATPLHPTNATLGPFTAECRPYKLTNDLEDSFCYDPARPPADPPERCGDVFAKGVTLTTDWQFYKVPFTELRQEGYAKQFGTLDLSKITLVRFTWSQGWVDVWLDDVRFYRTLGFTGQTQ